MTRLAYWSISPAGNRAALALSKYLGASVLDQGLLDLVYLRVSQMNGCAYCLDLHARDARAHGMSQQKMDTLAAWREAPLLFSPRECTALEWAEAITRIAETRAPEDVYVLARQEFSEAELVDLTFAIGSINLLNRLAISFRRNLSPAAEEQTAASQAD